MNIDLNLSPVIRLLLILTSLVVLLLGMHTMAPLLNPLLISLAFAILLMPPLFWLQRQGLPKWLALTIIIIGVTIVGLIIITIVGISLNELSNNIPIYQARLAELQTDFLAWLESMGVDTAEAIPLTMVSSAQIVQLFSTLVTGLGNFLTYSLLILTTVVFMLIEASILPDKLRQGLGKDNRLLAKFVEFSRSLNHYLVIKTWISLMVGGVVTIWVWFLGIDFALLWGFIAFLLNYIPGIGSLVASIPAIFIALVEFGVDTAFITGFGYWVINYGIGWGVEPRMMGRGLNLSLSTVFISLIFWSWVLGPVGLFLALPLTVFVKFILESYEETYWLAILMSNKVSSHPLKPAPLLIKKSDGESAPETS